MPHGKMSKMMLGSRGSSRAWRMHAYITLNLFYSAGMDYLLRSNTIAPA